MSKYSLIIIHRGESYERDFQEISEKVVEIDPRITVYFCSSGYKRQIPAAAWANPALTVAITSKFLPAIRRGPILRNFPIPKLVQASRVREAGLNTPPIQAFKFGMKLDPLLFGNLVILKPMTLTSKGLGVHLFRRARAERLKPGDFPPDHPIHSDPDGYLVQRFIDTGPHPSWNRVITFFGQPIYAVFGALLAERPPLDAPDEVLESATIAIQGAERQRIWQVEDDVIDFAKRIGATFGEIPLLAIDMLREASTGRLYFLEGNPGGNVWHFSSDQPGGINLRLQWGEAAKVGRARALELGRERMIAQFGAFDVCARVLVEKTLALAA